MTTLSTKDFTQFFNELWEVDPFPWQARLLQRVVDDCWPEYLDLPTASGKTATLDVAVFALALQAEVPAEHRRIGRRIFFVVNRRVIVDEAFNRASKLAQRLQEAPQGTVAERVAQALKTISGDPDAPPLDIAMLRGGIVRDNRWARSVTQTTIITSTIDQVGSRLLFRGYGVSEGARPLHAALITHDSILLLDEAHISQPFVETLQAVQRFRGVNWAKTPITTPFAFVQMTATPGEASPDTFGLETEDVEHPVLARRHGCSKRVALAIAQGAKGKNPHPPLARTIVQHATQLVGDGRRNIAIVVNRVATARQIAALLPVSLTKAKLPVSEVHLAIGRMRPIDRDQFIQSIQERVGPDSNSETNDQPMFVVATQCIEVGADFDFDGMVSECASMDAIRQRFGRLNRRGRDIDARGVVVVREDQVETADDPIYGAALSETWQWLKKQAPNQSGTVDFGIHAIDDLLQGVDMAQMLAPRLHAPVMFPAYVDAWVQTSPTPVPDPDICLFIHGPERGEPDVQVCWRDDLEARSEKDWVQVVSMLPPTSPECMTVPIGIVRRWLRGDAMAEDDRGDTLDGLVPEDEEGQTTRRAAVLWRGIRDSQLIKNDKELRPGDTVVLPVHAEGWEAFGHIPENSSRDVAEEACRRSTGIVTMRVRPGDIEAWPASGATNELQEWLQDPEQNLRATELRSLLGALAEAAPETEADRATTLDALASNKWGFEYERYPNGHGVIFRTRRPQYSSNTLFPAMDDGEDRSSSLPAEVTLSDHLRHVAAALNASLPCLPVTPWTSALQCAAALHDIGKADERFQAMLLRGNIYAARARKTPLAKSGGVPMSRQEWEQAVKRCGFPSGFRHEMLSMQLAARAPSLLPDDDLQRALALHLIAVHHGCGRPFAPVVLDEAPPAVNLESIGMPIALSSEERAAAPPHRLDSGVAERFWKLTRHFGWWGLAYFETVLRLADQRASQRESEATSWKAERQPAEAIG